MTNKVNRNQGPECPPDTHHLNPKRLNSYTASKLKELLRQALHGISPDIGFDKSDLPHELLRKIYQELEPLVRGLFQDILLEFLFELAMDHQSSWPPDPADELLLLLAEIFQDPSILKDATRRTIDEHTLPWVSPARDRCVHLLAHVADGGNHTPGIQIRALQTLAALGYKANPVFWTRHYAANRASAGAVLAGLNLFDTQAAFDWLASRPDDPFVFDALCAALPSMVATLESKQLRFYLDKLYQRLPQDKRSELSRCLALLGLEPKTDTVLSQLDDTEIAHLATIAHLHPATKDPPDRADLERTLAVQVYRMGFVEEQALQYPFDVRVLIATCAHVRKDPGLFRLPTRKLLRKSGQQLLLTAPEDPFAPRLAECVIVLEDYDIDYQAELKKVAQA